MIEYPLASTTWGSEEIEVLQEVIRSGIFTMGKRVRDFEEQFAEYQGSKYSIMFNSGSSANLALIAALRYLTKPLFEVGDEIIVPSVSWSTTYYPISQHGAKLNFVDIDLDTLNIDTEKIQSSITERTRAIFVVNLLGNPADFLQLQHLAKKYNLVILEDNCESLGATFAGRKTGSFGLGGSYSFFFSHHMSTMEGGMVTTDDEELAQALKSIRAHGWTRELPDKNFVFSKSGSEWDDLYRFVLPGYNLRPLELEGALGQVQLRKLDSFVETRQRNAAYFLDSMKNLRGYRLQKENGASSWFGFSIILQGSLLGKRSQLVTLLKKNLIESRPIVAGNFTRNPVMKHLSHSPLIEMPNADIVHDQGLFVGNHHYDLQNEIHHLVNVLTEFERENS